MDTLAQNAPVIDRPRSSAMLACWPVAAAVAGALAVLLLRLAVGAGSFITDEALMMLALACYLTAAVIQLTGLWAPAAIAPRLGMVTAALGVFFNLSSWLVRWVAAYDRELAIFNAQGADADSMPWVFRYVPFANLYDLSLAFAFGAGLTTLAVMRRPQFRAVAAVSLPMAALVLVLARFIGADLIDLPPVLDSYWRPIHVGIASVSYGVALVCFAVAILYLLKDGVRVESMRIWACLFTLAELVSISNFSVLAPSTFGTYSASVFNGPSRASLPLRAELPYVGWMMSAVAAGAVISVIAYLFFIFRGGRAARVIGNYGLYSALALQGAAIGMLVYQISALGSVRSLIDTGQYRRFGEWMMERQAVPAREIAAMGEQQLYDMGNKWITENAAHLHLSLNANPVELTALITSFAAIFFVVIFGIRTERLRAALPGTVTLDGLMYKLGTSAFVGLALLLMTGAVWANESWGRYWGWDAKEVGALVAWLTYAGFLHSRIAYGWRGRRSAYFAIVAFLFIIFTYLGVSYLLPGLHSYA